MNIVTLEQLVKIYHTRMRRGNITALNEVSLDIEQGEIFGLLGPNGAGKTTLMKILLGITRPTTGQVVVMGLPPGDAGSREKVGYLPENHRFPSHLTGMGLLQLAGRMCGMPTSAIKGRAEELLAVVGMDKWGDTKIRKYSKGMMQRIGLAQALINDPDLLCLDEPTDGVDPVGKVEIRQVLEKVRAQGKTVLLNSHLLSEVESVADRVAILSKGRVKRLDSVSNLTSRQLEYEIEADVGDRFIEIPEEIGKQIAVTANGMRVELKKKEGINYIIDELRQRRINIYSIQPVRLSLEQSFFELVQDQSTPGGTQGTGGAV
ncbi:ATP-binding cassette domain-containing protein [candidate division GN15 bacterium]|nr:ATP-binding cassette domain-containing protein [candidate division GN15 bacterium]